MKLSKKLILTQTIALAATSSAFAASNNINKLSRHIKSGNSILAPMVSNSVNGFGVNNELFLLSQKQNGSLKDGVVYINGKLNAAVNYFNISPENQAENPATGPNQSTVLNPGLDLAITATKGWFTGFVDLSTNAGSKPFVSWCESGDDTCTGGGSINPYTGLAVFQPIYDGNPRSQLVSPNQPGIGLLQAYLMLGDLNKMPLYFLAGRKYVDFGSFANQEQTWQPLTNYFNQNVQNQLALGFYQNGIHGAVTLFKSPWTVTDPGGEWPTEYVNNQLSTLAATLSYGTNVKNIGLHAGVSYTSNLNPQNIAWLYALREASKRINGGIIFAEVNFKPITITANYGSAMTTVQSGTQNKPYAWDVGVKFDFNLMNHANWLSGNYSYINPQLTSAGAGNWLKLSQWLFGWHVELAKNVNATLQYGYQKVGGGNTDWTPVKYNFFALGANFSF